jgi:hypothetical protein
LSVPEKLRGLTSSYNDSFVIDGSNVLQICKKGSDGAGTPYILLYKKVLQPMNPMQERLVLLRQSLHKLKDKLSMLNAKLIHLKKCFAGSH